MTRRRGLLFTLLHGDLGGLLVDGELSVPVELEAQFAAERRAEFAAQRAVAQRATASAAPAHVTVPQPRHTPAPVRATAESSPFAAVRAPALSTPPAGAPGVASAAARPGARLAAAVPAGSDAGAGSRPGPGLASEAAPAAPVRAREGLVDLTRVPSQAGVGGTGPDQRVPVSDACQRCAAPAAAGPSAGRLASGRGVVGPLGTKRPLRPNGPWSGTALPGPRRAGAGGGAAQAS